MKVRFIKTRGHIVVVILAVLGQTICSGVLGADRTGSLTVPNVFSMGQPSRSSLTLGVLSGYRFDLERGAQRYFLDLQNHAALPHLGALNLTAEIALQNSGGDYGMSAVLMAQAPIVRVGLEFDESEDDVFLRLSAGGTFWRYGFFRLGEILRLDYTPGKKEVQAGFVFRPPWQSYHRNRPRHTHVPLQRESGLPGPIEVEQSLLNMDALESVAHSIIWINSLLTPRLLHDIANRKKERARLDNQLTIFREHLALPGHSFNGEDSTYHAELERCFLTATGDAVMGSNVADIARNTIHHQVALPIDRLFGQRKRPRRYDGFLRTALKRFESEVNQIAPTLPEINRAAAREVFRRVLVTIKQVLEVSQKRWKNERLVWLPLNYGLRAEDYDDQAEMNEIIAQLVNEKITDCNKVTYLQNDQWYRHLEKMILETEIYQVFLIHDISGKQHKIDDEITWRLIADGYLEAFISAVGEINRGERDTPPVFMVYLDEHYYELNHSRGVLSFMEKIFQTEYVTLDDSALTDQVNKQLRRLHEAIKASPVLSHASDSDLKRLFKIHVSITNTYDRSVASDAILRDHRKMAYRDVFENEPGRGVGIIGGMGVGSHYVGRYWEDRSLLVRGPLLAKFKSTTRDLILSQGYDKSTVPEYLRAGELSEDFENQCADLRERGWTTNALVTMNACGFGGKSATVLKAALYNLAGRKMILVAPDSIWTCDFWVGMFVGAALRGCQLYAISPQPTNAPGASPILLELVGGALSAMIQSQQTLKDAIDAAGGALHVGLYDRDFDVSDVRSRLESFSELVTGERSFLKNTKLHSSVVEAFVNTLDSLKDSDFEPAHLIASQEESRPKLHFKVQFLLNESALSALALPQAGTFLQAHLDRRLAEVSGTLGSEDMAYFRTLAEFVNASKAAADAVEDSDNSICMMIIGSHNQDRRSMLLDGEALALVTGSEAFMALPDMALILGTVNWVEDVRVIDEFFPNSGGLLRAFGKWIKSLI